MLWGKQGEVTHWLAFASHELLSGCMAARAHINFGRTTDIKLAQEREAESLALMDTQLFATEWLVLERPTIADIACFPYAALAEEAGISLLPYQNLRKWFERVYKLPGYVAMQGLPGFNS